MESISRIGIGISKIQTIPNNTIRVHFNHASRFCVTPSAIAVFIYA